MMEQPKRIIRCPRCRQQTVWQDNPYKPFCSNACQQVDLGRWANEDYTIAGAPAPPEDDLSEF